MNLSLSLSLSLSHCSVQVCSPRPSPIMEGTMWSMADGFSDLKKKKKKQNLYHLRFHNLAGTGKTNLERDIRCDEI